MLGLEDVALRALETPGCARAGAEVVDAALFSEDGAAARGPVPLRAVQSFARDYMGEQAWTRRAAGTALAAHIGAVLEGRVSPGVPPEGAGAWAAETGAWLADWLGGFFEKGAAPAQARGALGLATTCLWLPSVPFLTKSIISCLRLYYHINDNGRHTDFSLQPSNNGGRVSAYCTKLAQVVSAREESPDDMQVAADLARALQPQQRAGEVADAVVSSLAKILGAHKSYCENSLCLWRCREANSAGTQSSASITGG